MPKKLAVVVIHGMGDQKPDFADGFIAEVERHLVRAGHDPGSVEWGPIWWAERLSNAESNLWQRLTERNRLDYASLRLFVLNALGDAVAYRKVEQVALAHRERGVYEDIHHLIAVEVKSLRERARPPGIPSAPELPLVVVAHSLGAHILSNYVWDAQKSGAPTRGNDFEDMKTICAIVTLGCNIPLFTLAHSSVLPIRFPLDVRKYFPQGTDPAELRAATTWRNYFDRDDVLGWPLRPLSDEYGKAVDADIQVDVGGPVASWNPLSHARYWKDRNVTLPAAATIGRLLDLAS